MSAHANGHVSMDERQMRLRAREELREAHFALLGAGAYARRKLGELGHLTAGTDREADLIEALQHIQTHCLTACAAITTVDVDQSTRRGTT